MALSCKLQGIDIVFDLSSYLLVHVEVDQPVIMIMIVMADMESEMDCWYLPIPLIHQRNMTSRIETCIFFVSK